MDGYAGDVTPVEAWQALEQDRKATLIDVRTEGEWRTVGIPDLAKLGREPRLVQWSLAGGMFNARFMDEIDALGLDPQAPVYVICRTGGRSAAAASALTEAGFARVYNVAGGMEGPPDARGQRGTVEGWKADGLPWVLP